MNSSTPVPSQKITAYAAASAVVVVACWLLSTYGHVDVPLAVQGALSTLIGFAAGYLVPPADRDVLVSTETPKP
jgi:hypothetical protein